MLNVNDSFELQHDLKIHRSEDALLSLPSQNTLIGTISTSNNFGNIEQFKLMMEVVLQKLSDCKRQKDELEIAKKNLEEDILEIEQDIRTLSTIHNSYFDLIRRHEPHG